jgi:hypothetical protein
MSAGNKLTYFSIIYTKSEFRDVFLLLKGLLNFTALLVFSINGSSREWMPKPHTNFYSFSFWFHFVAVITEFVAASCFLVETKTLLQILSEAIRHKKRNQNLDYEDEEESF